MLAARVLRAQAPVAVFARQRLIDALLSVGIPADHLQPGRAHVVRGEHHAPAEVRRQMRPRHLPGQRLEHDRVPFARVGGLVLRIVDLALLLAHRHVAVPRPIQDGGVVGDGLALLVILVTGLAHRRQLHFHPVLDGDRGRVGFPVALALLDDLELLAEPVDRLADQFVGGNRGLDAALAIRQLAQIRHHVVPQIALLDRVVHAPVAPHAGHVMVRDVAVEQEIAGQLLAEAGPALRFQVERFGRTDDFDVDAVRLMPDDRILYRTVRAGRPEVHVVDRPRAARPPDGASMRMVAVEHFGPAVDQAELRWIADVGTGNRRGRITEGIGAIAHRLVLEPEVLVLHVHVVDTERLAAIVDRASARTIGIGQRVALGQKVALLVQWPEGLVADFVVVEHELAEVRARPVLDHDLPAAGGRGRIAAAERFPVRGPARLDDERSEEPHDGQLAVVAEGVELADALLGVRVDVPLEIAALVLGDDGVGIGGRGGRAGGTYHHGRPMDVQADVLAAFQLVGQLDLDAIALVGADGQRLNPLGLHAGNDGAGIEALLVAGFLVLGFLRAHLVEVLVQHIHVAGIVIEPLIQRDLDVDRGHVVLLDRRGRGALAAARHRHRFDAGIGHEQHVLPAGAVLVHHRLSVVHPGVDALHLRIMGHMLHDALMLLLDHRRPLGLAGYRVFDDRLSLELFRPSGKLMVHRHMGRRSLRGCERSPEQGHRCHHTEHAGGYTDPYLVGKHGPASLKW